MTAVGIGPGIALADGSFMAGTRIAVPGPAGHAATDENAPEAPDSERRIEELAPGDMVRGASGLRTVMRIDKHLVDIASHPAPGRVTPVRLRAEALGPGQPRRDLLLPPEGLLLFRPGHADTDAGLAVADLADPAGAEAAPPAVLVPVGALLNGASIAREPASGVFTWYVLELDAHDVVLAENVPTATCREGTDRRAGSEEWDGPARPRERLCAPRLSPGPALASLRQRLANVAPRPSSVQVAGAAPEPEPDIIAAMVHDPLLPVRLVVDGAEIRAARGREPLVFRFLLPAGCGPARLVSAAGDSPAASDSRRLGVCVTGLELDGEAIDLDGPVAGPGFHPAEAGQGGAWRWTDGRAWLVLPHSTRKRLLAVRVNDWHEKLARS